MRPPVTGLRRRAPAANTHSTRDAPDTCQQLPAKDSPPQAICEEDTRATTTLQMGTLRHSAQGHAPPARQSQIPAQAVWPPILSLSGTRSEQRGPSADLGQLFTSGGLKAEGPSRDNCTLIWRPRQDQPCPGRTSGLPSFLFPVLLQRNDTDKRKQGRRWELCRLPRTQSLLSVERSPRGKGRGLKAPVLLSEGRAPEGHTNTSLQVWTSVQRSEGTHAAQLY